MNLTLDDLKRYIDSGQPVLLAIQAWAADAVDWSQDWNDGHYVIAVGYDQDSFYFMDPSTLGNYTFIPINEFLERWHDIYNNTRLIHLGIVLSRPSADRYDADRIKRMS